MTADIKKPRRVLHVLRPAAGGMKGHVLQLASGLEAYGYQAEIACPGDSDVMKSALAAGLEVRAVPIPAELRPLREFEAVLALADVIRHGGYALVHAHGFQAGLVGRIAAILTRHPKRVVTVHNHVLYREIRPSVKRTYVAVERGLSKHVSRMIAVSDAIRGELVELYGIDGRLVRTIHNGLDLAPFLAPVDSVGVRARYGLPRDAVVLGCAVRFAPSKAMDALVEAAVPVLERFQNAWLLLAGDGPTRTDTERKAASSPVADRIVFPGFESDVPGLLGALDVYVSATLSEGLPLGVIEAMAAGLPVVSTEAGGTAEVVKDGETGILVRVGDGAALTSAMIAAARDASLRRRMGDSGRCRAVEEFTEARMLEKTAETYEEVIGG